MKPKLRLRDVTVCAADSSTPLLAARALELCLDRCDFADAILFSDAPVDGGFRHVAIDRLKSLDDYSRFCLREMPKRIETDFVLVVQWDGYVVDAAAWTSAFLKYDYIGAVMYPGEGGALVGNGGFSLRSRKLLAALPTFPVVAGMAEDWAISKVYRKALEEDFGIRFAPVEVAERFSYEVKYPGRRTFGFHGPPNFWRHEGDAAILQIYGRFPPDALGSMHFFWLIVACLGNGRAALAAALYAMIRNEFTPDIVLSQMTRWVPRETGARVITALEPTYLAGRRPRR